MMGSTNHNFLRAAANGVNPHIAIEALDLLAEAALSEAQYSKYLSIKHLNKEESKINI